MERTGVDVDSNSLVETIHPYANYVPPQNASFGVMYNLFKPGNNFNLSLLDSDSSSSADPIRADCSLNDGVALGLCSPKEEIFQEVSSKRTNVHIQIEDDVEDLQNYTENESLMECSTYNLQNFVPNISQSCAMKTSCCNVDVSDNNDYMIRQQLLEADDHNIDKDHSSPYSETHIPQSDVESELKQSESLHVKPQLTVPFLTMENSNNAIDNNLHINASNDQSTQSFISNNNAKNHIFKLPNNELTFNGTLKHLQKLQPIVSAIHNKDEYIHDNHKDDMAEYFPYKSSDELTNSSPSGSVCSSKSGIFSSASQFPSDCDAEGMSNELPPKSSETDSGSVEIRHKNVACEKNFTFAGTVSPLILNQVVTNGNMNNSNGHNKSNESSSSVYESGPQSPNLFSDDEDEYVEQKNENEKLAATLVKFEEFDLRLIKLLEKTLQGVLPPPSVTICQLSVDDILGRYKANLQKFENSQNNDNDKFKYEYDPEASASMTPPRQINSDSMIEPSLSSSMTMAFENTMMPDQSVMLDNFTNPNQDRKSRNNVIYINGNEDIATNEDWPQITNYRFHGVHYNSTQHSETVDCLLSRYASRYVGCETASSCITIPMTVGSGYRGMVRRQHPSTAGAHSPGTRLSHLARRRAAFCTAATLTAPINRAKQILIDRKKLGSRTRRTPGKKTPGRKTPGKRTPGKKTPGKKTPTSSQKKAVARRLAASSEVRVKAQPTRETSKRALFLSPDNIPKPSEVQVQHDLTKPSTSRVMKSKRALFGSPNKSTADQPNVTRSESKATGSSFSSAITSTYTDVGRKRTRDDSFDDFIPMSKLQKSLSFGGDKITSSTGSDGVRTLTRRATDFTSAKNDLSDIHKKKLLWAVAEALRAHGIGLSHEAFKQHATSLVRLTRKLCTLPVHTRALKTPFSSTSDTLLKIARQHAFSVIKGKSVEELFAEEQVKQMNSSATKVTGYVPLNYYDSSRASASAATDKNSENSYGEVKVVKSDIGGCNKKTVLQDKTVNIDTNSGGPVELEIKKTTLFRDGESKLRARRQISFDNIEPSKR